MTNIRKQKRTIGKRRLSKLQMRELEAAPGWICCAIFEMASCPTGSSESLWNDYPVWDVGTFEQFIDRLEARELVSRLLFRGRYRRRSRLAELVRELQSSGRVIFYECEGLVMLSERELLQQEIAQGRAYLAAA